MHDLAVFGRVRLNDSFLILCIRHGSDYIIINVSNPMYHKFEHILWMFWIISFKPT